MPLYMTLVLLSANAPKQKIFAINESLLSGITFWYLVPSCICRGMICWFTGVLSCCTIGVFFGVVLCMPCRGRFMWPFAVAGLGLRYLSISFLEMFGHPLRKLFWVALRSVDILGLHSNWCENFTFFARVEMEWANCAVCWTVSCWLSIFYVGVWSIDGDSP